MFAIDIDGTIATYQNTNAYAAYLNETLDLSIPLTWRAGPGLYRELVSDPSVLAYVAGSEERKAYFKAVCEAGQYSPIVQSRALPLPGAVEALHTLSQEDRVIYVTCRKESTKAVTMSWLTQYGFPHPESLYHCQQYYGKYLAAYQVASPNEKIILIDNQARDIVLSYKGLVLHHREVARAIVQRLVLVAFGRASLPNLPGKLPFPVQSLDSWMNWQQKLEQPAEYRVAVWQQAS